MVVLSKKPAWFARSTIESTDTALTFATSVALPFVVSIGQLKIGYVQQAVRMSTTAQIIHKLAAMGKLLHFFDPNINYGRKIHLNGSILPKKGKK